MKKVRVPNGIITIVESKAECPECERKIPFDEIEEKWVRQDNHVMKMKCKCKRFIGITTNRSGDFIAFDLKQQPK
jgi:hypothetical protein